MLKCPQNHSVRFLIQIFSKLSPLVEFGKPTIKKTKQNTSTSVHNHSIYKHRGPGQGQGNKMMFRLTLKKSDSKYSKARWGPRRCFSKLQREKGRTWESQDGGDRNTGKCREKGDTHKRNEGKMDTPEAMCLSGELRETEASFKGQVEGAWQAD